MLDIRASGKLESRNVENGRREARNSRRNHPLFWQSQHANSRWPFDAVAIAAGSISQLASDNKQIKMICNSVLHARDCAWERTCRVRLFLSDAPSRQERVATVGSGSRAQLHRGNGTEANDVRGGTQSISHYWIPSELFLGWSDDPRLITRGRERRQGKRL